MDHRRLAGVILGTVAIGNVTMPAQDQAARLRITVYDQSHLPDEVAASAFDQLRRTFRQAGIAVELTLGDLAAEEASLTMYTPRPQKGHEQEVACGARRDIALKIMDVSPPGLRENVLGMATPLAPGGLNVRVFNDRIRGAARWHDRPYAIVLSYAIAHEIGHVLLRSDTHAKWGLMSSVWTEHEYAQLTPAAIMFFTREESRKMLLNVQGMGCGEVRLATRPIERNASGYHLATLQSPGTVAER